jgi:hypothetical protein
MSCQRPECKRAGRCGCGFPHGTEPHGVEFTITDNGHGQTITQGEPPRWSTTPPTEPGWYWTRHTAWSDPAPGRVFGAGSDKQPCTWSPFYRDGEDWTANIEWYPVRISEPPR